MMQSSARRHQHGKGVKTKVFANDVNRMGVAVAVAAKRRRLEKSLFPRARNGGGWNDRINEFARSAFGSFDIADLRRQVHRYVEDERKRIMRLFETASSLEGSQVHFHGFNGNP